MHTAKMGSFCVAAILVVSSVCSTVLAQPKEALPPGRLIQIGQRKVHLFCEGTGGPTVIIEVGSSTPARVWRGVQDKIAAFTHVCAYDRAGYGWSDPEPKPRTMVDRAQELHNVLQMGGEHPPYILLGHSYGGFLVRLFAKDHPGEVIGMVLVDAAEEGSFSRPQRFFDGTTWIGCSEGNMTRRSAKTLSWSLTPLPSRTSWHPTERSQVRCASQAVSAGLATCPWWFWHTTSHSQASTRLSSPDGGLARNGLLLCRSVGSSWSP